MFTTVKDKHHSMRYIS